MDSAKTTNKQGALNNEPQTVVVVKEPEREIKTWIAASRPFRRKDRQFYVTTFAIAGIVGLILFLAEGVMPVLLIISLMFLYYVLSTVEPEKIEYKITNKGMKLAGSLTEWQNLKRFWFIKRLDSDVLVFETTTLTGRLELVIKSEDKEEIKKAVSAYVPFEEVPSSTFDVFTEWVAKKIPGNK